LEQFRSLKSLFDKEISANPGLYDWLAEQLKFEADAAVERSSEADQRKTKLDELARVVDTTEETLEYTARRAANLALLPLTTKANDEQDYWWPPRDEPDKGNYPTRAYPPGEYPSEFLKFVTALPANIASELAAKEQVRYSSTIQKMQLQLDLLAAASEIKIASLQQKAAEIRAKWEQLNKDFSRQQVDIVNGTQEIRTQEAVRKDGVLNFGERMNIVSKRYELEFGDTLARMSVASVGLQRIFGFDVLLPGQQTSTDPFPVTGHTATREFHEACGRWIREAALFLTQFGGVDQGCVQPISVNEILGEAAWTEGLKQGRWTFPISQENLQQMWDDRMYHVRIQGLSAFAISDDASAVWQLKVKVPATGKFDILADPNTGRASELREMVEQGDLPPCRVGRARSRASVIPADIVGVTSAFNASPFGNWTIWLGMGPLAGTHVYPLKDIQLDLHLAYRVA
jgi:hypothetical protein